MKNITTILIATLSILVFTACTQQKGMQKAINAEINKRSGFLMDSLNNVCISDYDKKLDDAVASAIAVIKKSKANKAKKTKAVVKPTNNQSTKIKNTPKYNRPGVKKQVEGRVNNSTKPTNYIKGKPKFNRSGTKKPR